MIRRQLECTNGSWCQSCRPIGTRHHCQRPENLLLRSGASRAGSVMPCCWGCRASHYPMGSALCSRLSCRKPPAFPRFSTCVSGPFGGAFWRHTPVYLRFRAISCRVLAAHARLPLFLALLVPHRVETSACMFWGTLGAPGRVYSQGNRAPSGGLRGAAAVPKTTFSLVTPPDLLHRRHTHRHS